MRHRVVKTYGHDLGLSACFRQHRAASHCRHLHGYALAITLTFESDALDENGWVIDFGSLKPIKEWLCNRFDHKLLVAHDDPCLANLTDLQEFGLAQVEILPAVGCEAFASQIMDYVQVWLAGLHSGRRLRVVGVEVREHGANAAQVLTS